MNRPTTSRLTVFRAGWGAIQLVAPGLMAGAVARRPLDGRGKRVVRVLGARHVVQAAASGRDPVYPVLALGVEVDCLHAASMLALGLVDRTRRRDAFADGFVAGAFALAGVVAAHRAVAVPDPAPDGIAGLRDRLADRVARLLVPRYRSPAR